MARQRFAVADSDMHVIEPADLWINYIEPQFKARAPVGLTEVPRDVAIEWEGKRIPNRTPLSRQMLRVTQTAQATATSTPSGAATMRSRSPRRWSGRGAALRCSS